MKHTVTVSLEDEDYQALKELAHEQDRYINEQARHMLRGSLAAYAEPDIRKFTGLGVPDEPLRELRDNHAEDIRDNTSTGPTDTSAAKQEPLPG